MSNEDIKLGIVIQARTGSTRLPSKVILDFYNGNTILDIILNKFIDPYFNSLDKILATSNLEVDKQLEESLLESEFLFFQGSEKDVLDRFVNVGMKFNLTHILRVCADNPFLNIAAAKALVDKLYDIKDVDYLSYRNIDGLPTIRTHLGLYSEIVSMRALEEVVSLTNEEFYHEHVTNYIYERPNVFNVLLLPAHASVFSRKDIRLTIDDEDDFSNISELYFETSNISEDIPSLVQVLDNTSQKNYKKKMIVNINKYSK